MERCAAFAREQVALLQEEENKIKTELELLWNKVGEGLGKAEDERDGRTLRPLLRRKSSSPVRIGGISSSLPAVSTMRGFAPSTYHHGPRTTGRAASPMHAPGRSGLASSVAVSGFHHPKSRYQDKARSPEPVTNGREPHSSVPLESDDVPDTPSTLSSGSVASDDSVDLPDTLRRNMNERIDISASLQVFNSVLEKEAAKKRAQAEAQESKGKAKEADKGESLSPEAKKKPTASSQSSRGNGEAKSQSDSVKNGEPKRERRRSGNKRVTFDVEPDVVTIKREITAEVDDDALSSGADGMSLDLPDGSNAY